MSLKANDIVQNIRDYKEQVRTFFVGPHGQADFTGAAPVYLAQKIDSLIAELQALKARVYFHARHRKSS